MPGMAPADLPDPASPAEVAGASFPTKRRGYDPRAVTAFLTVVAEQLTRLRGTEADLRTRLEAATRRAQALADLDEATVAEVVGEESTRVLGTAREAARQIRERAEQAAANMVSAAAVEAERLRHEAELEVARRRDELTRQIDAELEAAKEQGRSMVDEARAYRERVLADLTKRRDNARAQIEMLTAHRDEVAAAFDAARRSATDVMARLGVEPELVPDPLADLTDLAGVAAVHAEATLRRGADTAPRAAAPDPSRHDLDPLAPASGGLSGTAEHEASDLGGAVAPSELESPTLIDHETMFVEESVIGTGTLEDRDGRVGIGEAPTTVPDEPAVAERALDETALDVPTSDDIGGHDGAGTDALDGGASGGDAPEDDGRALAAPAFDLGEDRVTPLRSPISEPVVHHPDIGAGDERSAPVISLFRSGSERRYGEDGPPSQTPEVSSIEDDPARDPQDFDEVLGVDIEEIDDGGDGEDDGEKGIEVSGVIDSAGDHSDADDETFAGVETTQGEVSSVGSRAPEPARTGVSVDDVFARLRAASMADVARDVGGSRGSVKRPEIDAESNSQPPHMDGDEISTDVDPDSTETSPQAQSPAGSPSGSEPGFPLDREQILNPLAVSVARRLKRVLADEQNAVLDAIRRGGADVAAALADGRAAHLERSFEAIRGDLLAAAEAGARWATENDNAATVDDSDVSPVREWLSQEVLDPFHRRLADALQAADGDPEGFAARSRHVFREWKSQRIDERVEDLVRLAHALGVLAAVTPGTPMCWLVDPDGPPCADAEDNALAGVVPAGEDFPTGHRHPPAHAGCRCLVAPIAG